MLLKVILMKKNLKLAELYHQRQRDVWFLLVSVCLDPSGMLFNAFLKDFD